MDRIKVRFFDDEAMQGSVDRLDLEQPDFVMHVDADPALNNNEVAWVPFSAVKYVELAWTPTNSSGEPARKVAIRFTDGDVIRGMVNGGLERRRYGLMVALEPADGELDVAGSERRQLAIPFTAIKALFYIREWDARGQYQGDPSGGYLQRRLMAPLVDVLSDIDMLSRLKDDGVISDEEFDQKRTILLERL